jgi:hypothetical protein
MNNRKMKFDMGLYGAKICPGCAQSYGMIKHKCSKCGENLEPVFQDQLFKENFGLIIDGLTAAQLNLEHLIDTNIFGEMSEPIKNLALIYLIRFIQNEFIPRLIDSMNKIAKILQIPLVGKHIRDYLRGKQQSLKRALAVQIKAKTNPIYRNFLDLSKGHQKLKDLEANRAKLNRKKKRREINEHKGITQQIMEVKKDLAENIQKIDRQYRLLEEVSEIETSYSSHLDAIQEILTKHSYELVDLHIKPQFMDPASLRLSYEYQAILNAFKMLGTFQFTSSYTLQEIDSPPLFL